MRFYLFDSKYPQFEKDEVHLLNNNLEAKRLMKSKFYESNHYRLRCARSLTELIFFVAPKEDFFYGTVEDFLICCETTFEQLCEKFGIEIISNAFPKDKFDAETLNRLGMKFEDYINDLSDSWQRAENNENYQSYNNPEITAAENEMRSWDEEDSSWRISNDLD
jgi:hypothetical protein